MHGSRIVFAGGMRPVEGFARVRDADSVLHREMHAFETSEHQEIKKTDGAALLGGKIRPLLVEIGGKFYALCHNGERDPPAFEVFDTELDTWSALPQPPFFQRGSGSIYDLGHTVAYVIAGTKIFVSAIGVSGGPDSMALCALTAFWKGQGLDGKCDGEGFIDGVLAIIVDHELREESTEEASIVSNRVAKMGIRIDVACCDWFDGKPKQGHVQEAAREMRYRIFQNVCVKNQIGVLLTAHHADDQAELFVIRLSRNSGILGLAGMPFTSQIFSAHTHSHTEVSRNYGILLVRPLLDFSKEDLYKICQGSSQEWVEDPTNQSLLYARNRIRMSLRDASCAFKNELQAVISACRETRVYIDYVCRYLMSKAVTVSHLGYAVIDLEILNQSKVEDICLSKFISLVLQFISQRHRPLRGNTSKLLIGYMRSFPCKTSLTAAGCFLSPAPGSRGRKALVCCSVDSPLPSNVGLSHQHFHAEQEHYSR